MGTFLGTERAEAGGLNLPGVTLYSTSSIVGAVEHQQIGTSQVMIALCYGCGRIGRVSGRI